MTHKLMKCGCASSSTHHNSHGGLEEGHPSCVVHDVCESVETPSFNGRVARCMYYGKGHVSRRNECSECSGKKGCECTTPSNTDAAFFVHKPKENYDEFYCGCCGWD